VNSENIQFLYLTTQGWKTGKNHTIEIWFVEYEGNFYLVAENREKSHWVQNIHHHAAITFRIGETVYSGLGRIITKGSDELLEKGVTAKMEQKYKWSDGLIIELKPVA
jgi:hypothetical protein